MKKITFIKTMLLAILIATASGSTFAQITSAADGNWSNPATWTGGVVPTSTNDVSITHCITVSAATTVECNNLIVTNTNQRVILAGANSILNIYGTLNASVAPTVETIIDCTLDATAKVVFKRTTNGPIFGATWAPSGTGLRFEVNLPSDITGTASTSVKAREITITSGTFDLATNELRPDNGANAGILTIQDAAVLKCFRLSRIGTSNTSFGTMTMNGTAKFQPNSSTASSKDYLPVVSGGFPVYIFSSSSTIEYVGSSSGTISVIPYQNLAVTLNASTSSRSFGAANTIAGNLTIGTATVTNSAIGTTVGGNITLNNDGVLASGTGSSTINANTGANILTINNGGVLQIVNRNSSATPPAAGTTTPFSTQYPGFETITLNTGSTVEYRVPGATAMGTQDVQTSYGALPLNYQNLTVSMTSSVLNNNATQYIPEGVSVAGKLKITTSTAAFACTQDVIFNNTNPLTVGSLEISRTGASSTAVQNVKLAGQTYNITGATALQNSGPIFQSSSTILNFNQAVTTSGTLTNQGILRFNNFQPTINFNQNLTDGASATTFSPTGTEVPIINFNNGTSGTPMTTTAANLKGAVTVNGYRTVSANGFRTSNSTTAAYSMNIAGTLDLGAYTSVATNTGGGTNTLNGTGTIKFTGSYATQISGYSTNNFQGTGILDFAGASLQTIPAGTYANVIVENAGGVTLGGNASLTGALTLTNGTLATGANTLTLNGTTSGTGLINTGGTGTLAFGGTAVQTLASSNLTSGAVYNLIVNAGSKLTSSGTIAATNFTINSDVTNGTGTLLDGGLLTATTSNVNQYLSSARNWYISSPMSNANAPTGFTYYKYDETGSNIGYVAPATDYWVSVTTGSPLNKGVGYIALPGSPGSTLIFTTQPGGTLNTGNVDITLTRSGAIKTGFNLIGNPYPAHLTWTQTFVDHNSALIEPTIWYRTNAGTVNNSGLWSFKTINASTGEASPLGTTAIIPPMQAFWVRAVTAGTTTLILNSDLTLSHQASNPLKAPAVKNSDRQRLRLQVNNGTSTDETLIYFDANASNGYDRYDSPKFEDATTVTQIYTTAGTEKLVINGMNSIPLDTEIGLGFVPGSATSFSIKANEISNLPSDLKVILKDNVTLAETDLTNGVNTYEFSPATTTTDRFSVIFRSAGAVTGIPTAGNDQNLLVYRNANNQIAVQIKGQLNDSYSLDVYNSVGQRLASKQATTGITIMDAPQSGVYFVTIKGNGNNTTKKVVIN